MPIRVETVTLPAFLASALVNGDTSGLSDPEDVEALADALEYVAPGRVVSADGEAYFSWSCDLPGYHRGCDVLEYTVYYHEKD